MSKTPELYAERVIRFKAEADAIFSSSETSVSRLVDVRKTAQLILNLSMQQSFLLDESLKAAMHGLYRSSHVSAWAALIDFLEHKLGEDGFVKLKSAMPRWKFNSAQELREVANEHQIVEAGRQVGLLTKAELKSLQGMLSKRNECAHPSGYVPSYNETLGYISEIIQRIENISNKTI